MPLFKILSVAFAIVESVLLVEECLLSDLNFIDEISADSTYAILGKPTEAYDTIVEER